MHSFGLVCRPSIRNPPHLFVEEMVKFSTTKKQFNTNLDIMKLLKAFTFVVGSNWEYWIVLVLVILSSVQSFFPCFKLSCFTVMLDFVIVAFVIFKFFLVFAFDPTYDGSHFPLRAENRIAIVRVGIALSFPFSLRHCSMAK